AGKPGRAAQSFVVVINDDKSSEPLVVASTPGAASEVLQGLDRPASETQLAAADPIAAPTTPAPVVTPAPAPAVEPATAPVVEPPAASAPAQPEPATTQTPAATPPAPAEPESTATP